MSRRAGPPPAGSTQIDTTRSRASHRPSGDAATMTFVPCRSVVGTPATARAGVAHGMGSAVAAASSPPACSTRRREMPTGTGSASSSRRWNGCGTRSSCGRPPPRVPGRGRWVTAHPAVAGSGASTVPQDARSPAPVVAVSTCSRCSSGAGPFLPGHRVGPWRPGEAAGGDGGTPRRSRSPPWPGDDASDAVDVPPGCPAPAVVRRPACSAGHGGAGGRRLSGDAISASCPSAGGGRSAVPLMGLTTARTSHLLGPVRS